MFRESLVGKFNLLLKVHVNFQNWSCVVNYVCTYQTHFIIRELRVPGSPAAVNY